MCCTDCHRNIYTHLVQNITLIFIPVCSVYEGAQCVLYVTEGSDGEISAIKEKWFEVLVSVLQVQKQWTRKFKATPLRATYTSRGSAKKFQGLAQLSDKLISQLLVAVDCATKRTVVIWTPAADSLIRRFPLMTPLTEVSVFHSLNMCVRLLYSCPLRAFFLKDVVWYPNKMQSQLIQY
jgi:hypothetical protein